VFGRRYWELQRHAYLFCAPTEVSGTHRERAGHYSWEAVTDQYERLLASVYEASRPGPLPQAVLEPELAPAG